MIAAVVLARKGSRRLPGKNKKILGGRSLVGWAISEAQKSKYIDEVVVSSDDYDVIDIAIDRGANIILRPPHLATDLASSYDALKHATKHTTYGDIIVLLQPTSPLRRAEDIDLCIQTLLTMNLDSAATSSDGQVPNGAVYCAERDWLFNGGNWDGEGVKLVPMPIERSIDIDTMDDFIEAEALLAQQ